MVHIILYVVDETHAWLTLVSFCQPLTASTIPLMPPEKTRVNLTVENIQRRISWVNSPSKVSHHSVPVHTVSWNRITKCEYKWCHRYQWDGHDPRKHSGATSKGVGQSSLNHSTRVCVCVCVWCERESLTILVSPSPVSASDHTSSGKDTAHCHSLRLLPATHPPPVVQTNEYTAVFVWKICVNPLAH